MYSLKLICTRMAMRLQKSIRRHSPTGYRKYVMPPTTIDKTKTKAAAPIIHGMSWRSLEVMQLPFSNRIALRKEGSQHEGGKCRDRVFVNATLNADDGRN